MKPFIVTASNLSAIANHHKYRDWKIALADILGRYNQVKGYSSVNQIIDKTGKLPDTSLLTSQAKEAAKNYLDSISLRKKGKAIESQIIDDLKQYSNLKNINTDDILLKHTMTIEDCPVIIYGRTDGKTKDGGN